jgi:hypothetical protein
MLGVRATQLGIWRQRKAPPIRYGGADERGRMVRSGIGRRGRTHCAAEAAECSPPLS